MKIMKFGGSSVADYPQMLKVFDIVNNTIENKIVVLSACKGITDKLEKIAILAADKKNTPLFHNATPKTKKVKDCALPTNNNEATNIIEFIKTHHLNILNATLKKYLIPATNSINTLLTELQNILQGISFLHELTDATKDSVLVYGELLSTTIFHFICKEKGLDNTLLDARNLIYTNDKYTEAEPNIELCSKNIIKAYNEIETDLVITQGFISSYNDNIQRKPTTLGRGGSDYSASIIGAVLNADEIQIWTDVDGVLSADPRYFENTFTIKKMSFQEIKDLSFWGAKVLHPKTIQPAIEKNINIKVLNTFNPTNYGTLITANNDAQQFTINSIIAKENCILYITDNDIELIDNDVLYSGYCNGRYIKLLDKKNITFSAMNVENGSTNTKDGAFLDCSVICITGTNFVKDLNLLMKFLSTLSCLKDVEIFQLLFEFSFNSVLIVVGECDLNKIVNDIHKNFLK